jgi:glucosamine--fructose-6-phosphate aminotransferase (isomerizing)
MCGIVGYIGDKNITKVLIDGLRNLEYRGYDSAGIAIFENNDIRVIKTKGRLSNLEKKIKDEGYPTGTCGIGHTRWATHGEPSDVNSHPHGSDRVVVVHNGIIENYMQLKEKLISHGYSFASETDTEVAAKLIDYFYKGDPFAAITDALSRLKGSYALGIMFRDFPNTIYAVRKDSPLIVGLGENENFIASDMPAILKYTREYYLIDENEIAILTTDAVKIYSIDGDEIQKEKRTATWDVAAAEKGGYPHFMLKEMFEQPRALRDTIFSRIKDGLPSVLENIPNLENIKNIRVVACGSAMHAGMVGKFAIEELSRVPVEVDIASEFRYRNPILSNEDLVIIISQSGETADTLAALRLAKFKGAYTVAIVNVVGSSIAREADSIIYTHAGPEIAVATTKAYSVQVAVMYIVGVKLALVKGLIDEAKAKELCETISSIPESVEKILKTTENLQHLASYYQNAKNLFFIGRGMDYASSMEGSLKLKEISYIHSEAYPAGELKHGTISLIVEGMPVIAIATQEELYEKTISNVKEVKARGANVLLICREGTIGAENIADNVIYLPNLPNMFMPSPTVVALQLFAYYISVLRGCDVDKPRNLAKSVTVE